MRVGDLVGIDAYGRAVPANEHAVRPIGRVTEIRADKMEVTVELAPGEDTKGFISGHASMTITASHKPTSVEVMEESLCPET